MPGVSSHPSLEAPSSPMDGFSQALTPPVSGKALKPFASVCPTCSQQILLSELGSSNIPGPTLHWTSPAPGNGHSSLQDNKTTRPLTPLYVAPPPHLGSVLGLLAGEQQRLLGSLGPPLAQLLSLFTQLLRWNGGFLKGSLGRSRSLCGAHTPSSQAWGLHCQSRNSILGIPETIFYGFIQKMLVISSTTEKR